ncbi:O-antigen ligase family protein [Nocardioides solisilvae]|uniref:O-antigen ligase family protein n=1 Tax=Nocardioides solisilvae TaxID=1542435 RepID=UPI000D742F2F|nr:O-antigen ligase family protein [Nocardioides solisilvae]
MPGTRRDAHLDAVTYLTFYLVLLVGLESRWVVAPLGGAGAPATLVALAGLCWWLFHQLQRSTPAHRGSQPVRRALLCVFLAFTASYAVAMSRPVAADEASTATLGMVALVGWTGVCLLAHDGVPTMERFDVLTRRLVLAGALTALLGLAQFAAEDLLIRAFTPPGLVTSAPLSDLVVRNGFARPAGTALHPIEFGAVLGIVLPIAISYARTTPTARGRHWAAVTAMAFAILLSGSRSAILSAVVGLLVLGVVWGRRARLWALATCGGMLAVVLVAVPGMAGTILKLFTTVGTDDSVASRTDSYPVVWHFIEQAPLLGRGYGTFLPSYRILDNQYLLLLVEVGAVGLVAFVALLAAAGWTAGRSRLLTGPVAAERGQGYVAAVAAAAVGLVTYDGLSFPTASGLTFLVVGLCGALWRLQREPLSPPRAARAEVAA